MDTHTHVVVNTNLAAYFQPFVRKALGEHRPRAGEVAEFYLVRLLADFARSQRLFQGMGPADPALAIQLSEALQAPSGERVSLLKRLGDYTLYMCGFFTQGLNLRLVDVNYYVKLGRSAYHHLSRTRTAGEVNLCPTFHELAEGFDSYVQVLGAVSDQSRTLSQREILALYRDWMHGGRPEAAARLRRVGLSVPPRGPTS